MKIATNMTAVKFTTAVNSYTGVDTLASVDSSTAV